MDEARSFVASKGYREVIHRIFCRIHVSGADLPGYHAPPGWWIHSYGPPASEFPGMVCVTTTREMPLAPGPQTILSLAWELMVAPACRITLSFLEQKLHVGAPTLESWLEEAGLGKDELGRPKAVHRGDKTFWLRSERGSITLFARQRSKPEPAYEPYFEIPADDE
jgi:hypothetical protein